MAALDAPSGADAHVRENVSPKPLDERRAFDARTGAGADRHMHGAARKRRERRLEPTDASWISRIRTQTRASTSPSVRTAISIGAASYGG